MRFDVGTQVLALDPVDGYVYLAKVLSREGRGRNERYLVHYVGYGQRHNRWLPSGDIEDYSKERAEHHEKLRDEAAKKIAAKGRAAGRKKIVKTNEVPKKETGEAKTGRGRPRLMERREEEEEEEKEKEEEEEEKEKEEEEKEEEEEEKEEEEEEKEEEEDFEEVESRHEDEGEEDEEEEGSDGERRSSIDDGSEERGENSGEENDAAPRYRYSMCSRVFSHRFSSYSSDILSSDVGEETGTTTDPPSRRHVHFEGRLQKTPPKKLWRIAIPSNLRHAPRNDSPLSDSPDESGGERDEYEGSGGEEGEDVDDEGEERLDEFEEDDEHDEPSKEVEEDDSALESSTGPQSPQKSQENASGEPFFHFTPPLRTPRAAAGLSLAASQRRSIIAPVENEEESGMEDEEDGGESVEEFEEDDEHDESSKEVEEDDSALLRSPRPDADSSAILSLTPLIPLPEEGVDDETNLSNLLDRLVKKSATPSHFHESMATTLASLCQSSLQHCFPQTARNVEWNLTQVQHWIENRQRLPSFEGYLRLREDNSRLMAEVQKYKRRNGEDEEDSLDSEDGIEPLRKRQRRGGSGHEDEKKE